MSVDSRHSLSKLEFWLLIVLVCSLPLSEAVKNITSLLFPLAWGWSFYQDKSAQIILGKWDAILAIFFSSACLSVLLAFEFGRNWVMLVIYLVVCCWHGYCYIRG